MIPPEKGDKGGLHKLVVLLTSKELPQLNEFLPLFFKRELYSSLNFVPRMGYWGGLHLSVLKKG